MFTAAENQNLVPYDGSFRQQDVATVSAEEKAAKKTLKKRLKNAIDELDELQQVMYAHDRYSLLLLFMFLGAVAGEIKQSAIKMTVSEAM